MITPAFLALLIEAIAKTIPASANESEADRGANLIFARTLFEAFHPTDALQAVCGEKYNRIGFGKFFCLIGPSSMSTLATLDWIVIAAYFGESAAKGAHP